LLCRPFGDDVRARNLTVTRGILFDDSVFGTNGEGVDRGDMNAATAPFFRKSEGVAGSIAIDVVPLLQLLPPDMDVRSAVNDRLNRPLDFLRNTIPVSDICIHWF
jgi:hypothetical protein